jgi:dTDP-4-dehydrorhamnose reductase
MKILIIGASGLVGGNIYNYLVKHTNWEITGTYNKFLVSPFIFLDASELSTWSKFINKTDWDVIIHTGALTHVDKCEEALDLSELLTVKSTYNLCKLASEKGSKLIYISTDYVFDGTTGPYSESDIPNPLCVYGKHKLEAENIVKSSLSNYLILRITNVYGNEVRNKNFLSRTIMQIKSNTNLEITAPYDQYATPVNALDIAKSILLLINDRKNGIYHIASTDFLNRVQFLQKINSYFGNKLIINPIKTNNLNQSAKRPLMGGLLSKKFLSEYPDFVFSNIDDYLRSNIDFNL